VIVGVTLVYLTGWLRLDPLIALAVAVHIVWTGVGLMRRSVAGLLDAAISPQEQEELNKLFSEYAKRYGVSFHAVRTRQAGARRFITFHFLVPDSWTVAQAHQLSEEIEARMRSMVPNAAIFTHIEPISDPCLVQRRRPGPLVARVDDLDVLAADVDERRRRDLPAAGLELPHLCVDHRDEVPGARHEVADARARKQLDVAADPVRRGEDRDLGLLVHYRMVQASSKDRRGLRGGMPLPVP
jgi:hypothetical protein